MNRAAMARAIADSMRDAYEAEGEAGDFDDAERHYRVDATEAELQADYEQWVAARGRAPT